MSPKRLFRALAFAEAVTWTILIVAMILKYAAGVDAAVLVGVNQRWHLGLIAFAVLTAIVPYATIPFEVWLMRRGRLEGEWRRDAGEHPADGSWVNRMLRWFLARPVLLTVVAVIGIAVVFSALLVIGPPGGREA
ncbi:MAG TPA: DUF3817 domain-containing protein [Microbacterium sp.]|nr:DUF3817 domain-containing protein [Microbacterium sp.]